MFGFSAISDAPIESVAAGVPGGLSVIVSESITLSEAIARTLVLSRSVQDLMIIGEDVGLLINPAHDEFPVRSIKHGFDVSWKTDILNRKRLADPNNYRYFDETNYVIGMTWDSSLSQPLGSVNKSLAEAILDNTSNRFTPEFLGGNSELYTSSFEPRKPVKIYAEIDPYTPALQFSGLTNKVATIDQRSGSVILQAADYIDILQSKFADQTAMFTGQRSDQIIGAILSQIGLQPTQYSLEQGQNIIGFAMYDSGAKVADVISALVEAEDGQFYQDETGIFHFENRIHYNSAPFNEISATISESAVLNSTVPNADQIVNVVEINYNPRVKTASTNIFTLSGSVTLPSGDTDVFFNFDNPVLAANAPVFTANSQPDGSGSDLTANISVKATSLFSQAVKYTFHNSSTTAYITSLTIQGRWAVLRYDTSQYFRLQDSSSVTAYQEQHLVISNDYIQDITWATSYAQLILNDYADPAKLLQITIRAKPSLRRGDLISYKGYSWRIYRVRSTLDATYGWVQELHMVQRGLASGTLTTYFKIGSSAIGGSDEIAP